MNHSAAHRDNVSALHSSTTQSTAVQDLHYLLTRAYQNLYGLNLPDDAAYVQPLLAAAAQLQRDPRALGMNDRALVQAFEDIIRISDAHRAEAEKHLARASNPVYLRESALDNALEHQKYLEALHEIMPKTDIRSAEEATSRVTKRRFYNSSAQVQFESAYQQLALVLSQN